MKTLLAFTLLVFSSFSNASILIEPQLAYAFSHKLDQTITITNGAATGTTRVNSSGTALEIGGRFGLEFFGLMAGASYHKGLSDKGSNLGAFIGYEAPILLRAWAAYHFDAEVNYDNTSTSGTSIELGVGYTALPLLSLNFIYRKYDMDELTSAGVTYGASDVTPTELSIGISLPLNI